MILKCSYKNYPHSLAIAIERLEMITLLLQILRLTTRGCLGFRTKYKCRSSLSKHLRHLLQHPVKSPVSCESFYQKMNASPTAVKSFEEDQWKPAYV